MGQRRHDPRMERPDFFEASGCEMTSWRRSLVNTDADDNFPQKGENPRYIIEARDYGGFAVRLW